MPFARLLAYLLHGSKGATQSVLNEFFQGSEEGIHMTQQALSKARTHFDHSPFLKAFYEVVNAEYNLAGLTREKNQTRLRENNRQDFQNQGIK